MRHLVVLILALAVAAAANAAVPSVPSTPGEVAPPAARPAAVFVVSGGGFGHGVGLNQYGALAQAKASRSYRDILAFYYPGTQLATTAVSKVRVLITEGRPTVTVASAVPFSVNDASGAVTQLPAGEDVLGGDLRVMVDGKPTPLPGPLTFRPGKGGTLTLDGKGYRGQLRLSSSPKGVRAIDLVGLDAYLFGVVAGEMPKDWPQAALEAQAVAARSYALASLVKSRDFDLYADPRSQAYDGVSGESPSTTAAVAATRGQILTYGGKVATTVYSSSSGGRTAASEDVFGFALPYLQARDDPWDALSPFHRWAPRSFTPASLAQALGLSAPVADVAVVETPSRRPASVTVVKTTGESVLLSAADVRARLRLWSTAFRIGVLRVDQPSAAAAAGAPVVVSGLARDVVSPRLERLGANGAWLPSLKVAPGPDGSFAVTVRPQATVTYRLTAAGEPGPALTIIVATGKPQ